MSIRLRAADVCQTASSPLADPLRPGAARPTIRTGHTRGAAHGWRRPVAASEAPCSAATGWTVAGSAICRLPAQVLAL